MSVSNHHNDRVGQSRTPPRPFEGPDCPCYAVTRCSPSAKLAWRAVEEVVGGSELELPGLAERSFTWPRSTMTPRSLVRSSRPSSTAPLRGLLFFRAAIVLDHPRARRRTRAGHISGARGIMEHQRLETWKTWWGRLASHPNLLAYMMSTVQPPTCPSCGPMSSVIESRGSCI